MSNMDIQLRDPALAAYVDELVNSGEFADATTLIEMLLRQKREDDREELDEETIAAITEADADIAAGRVYSVEQVAAELRCSARPGQ
ncbi:MAG TPA: hypothetical protein VGB55_02680 [Tepidisphaeraceae bacterium]|jgi:Arc/MetJ-type ribon-helix-helix transcriptional regulator